MATKDRAFTGAFALIVSATACAVVVLAAPRAVLPSQLPALRLPRAALARQRAADEALRARAPAGADVDAFLDAYREEGRLEVTGAVDETAYAAHRARLGALARDMFARLRPEEARALRLSLTEQALGALRGEPSEADHPRALLGRFPELLARYGYVDAAGRRLAPELAVRALYAARFNLICGRGLQEGMTPLEQTAHEGWTALHAGALAPAQRAEAARRFRALGGRYGMEAEAIWRHQGGDAVGASALLQQAYARTGWLRLRNLALGALDAASIGGI